MTKPKYPNRNGHDQVRDRLATLIGDAAHDARTNPRRQTDPIPVFSRLHPLDEDDPQSTFVDVDLPSTVNNMNVQGTSAPVGSPRTPWHTGDPPDPVISDGSPPPIDAASGDPPTRAPTRPVGAPSDLIDRLAQGRGEQLVERWLPGGHRALGGMRSLARRHRGAVLAAILLVATAIGTAIAMSSTRPAAESAPALPAAVSAMADSSAAPSHSADTHIVVSVVGKVNRPGLVTLTNGARVADAVKAAGGVLPDTDVSALNLARKLADGEQIYVGIPVPPTAVDQSSGVVAGGGSSPDASGSGGSAEAPSKKSKKGKETANLAPGQKVNLNTATADELEELPGVGQATAQRVIDWRSQHGSFHSIAQLRDVGGIGAAKFTKLKDWVTV